jgi:hypothetical protein
MFSIINTYEFYEGIGYLLFDNIYLQLTGNLTCKCNMCKDKQSTYRIRIYKKSKFEGMCERNYFNWILINSEEQLNKMIQSVKICSA